MGAGKKKKTLKSKEKPEPSGTVNSSAPARNLRKSELGAVIFCCKNHTFGECHSERLFGLPAQHFAYVKKISPGLPLFLFNCSDRKLHGIYEAASQGQLNINPYGWTAEGSDYTLYAAQVRIHVRTQCSPLSEDEFGPLIVDNYYDPPKLFWFELDRAQTHKLISTFTSHTGVSRSLRTTMRNNLPASYAGHGRGDVGAQVSQAVSAPSNGINGQRSSWDALGLEKAEKEVLQPKPDFGRSYLSVLSESNISISERKRSLVPEKKWSSLFKSENKHFEAHNSESACGNHEAEWEYPSDVTIPDFYSSWEAPTDVESREADEEFNFAASDANLPYLDESIVDEGLSCATPTTSHLNEESRLSEASADDNATETYEEPFQPEPNTDCSYSFAVIEMDSKDDHEEDSEHPFAMAEVPWGHKCVSEAVAVTEMTSSNIDFSLVVKLVEEVEELKVSHQKHIFLQQELVEAKAEIHQLKTRCHVLESRLLYSTGHVQEAVIKSCVEPCPLINDSILIVGGFDGSSWLRALCSYLPSRDLIRSLKPMTSVRKYATTATLNGELYVFGGVDGDVSHDTVESYNPISDQWLSRPPLNQKKGSLAGASLCGKIYAIGGGNGSEFYSMVEMLDMNIGKWIPTRSMLHKRFAPAAAELNGAIYVVGGYDGRNYLNSVERFDPREHSWTSLKCMSSRRGCHALTVLNDKLYALGGFNGSEIVSTIEIFDPRVGSWMMGESMNTCRGYPGAAVLGEKIYIIGGIRDNNETLDTIECYKEGCGWEVTNLKAVGKRCFFSAVVL